MLLVDTRQARTFRELPLFYLSSSPVNFQSSTRDMLTAWNGHQLMFIIIFRVRRHVGPLQRKAEPTG